MIAGRIAWNRDTNRGLTVELAKGAEPWDGYVRKAASDSVYHLWAYREVIEETFGHRSYYLLARNNGDVHGVLPLTAIRSRLFGDSLVSVPFSSYGGVLADSAEARELLLVKAIELAKQLRVRRIELRQGASCLIGWNSLSPKVTMQVELPDCEEDYFKRLTTSRRKRLRYVMKHGFRAEWGGSETLPVFYRVFAANMRNLGTPVYPYKLFDCYMRRLPGRVRILTLWDGNKAVASCFIVAAAKTLELPWAAALPESRKKEAPTVMYWTLIRKAIEEGFAILDLGRCTPGGGNYEFKRHWKPVERPLHWYYWLAPGETLPTSGADNPKFKFATTIWKYLPLAIANAVGPHLVRSIP